MPAAPLPARTPPPYEPTTFTDPHEAVAALRALYDRNTGFLQEALESIDSTAPECRFRALYPELRVTTSISGQVDPRRAFGHLPSPGTYATTITRPMLFEAYLVEQLERLMSIHDIPVLVGESDTPIPLHFAVRSDQRVDSAALLGLGRPLPDFFDVPNLDSTDDEIVNGTVETPSGRAFPLAPFTGPRIDYSLQRLAHYTATRAEHFQNFVLFTNYGFYVDEFCEYANNLMAQGGGGFTSFVGPGNVVTTPGSGSGVEVSGEPPARQPQMPAYHLTRPRHGGVTLINIGVGPSNAKTITDHVAVLRPHAWLMLGHCAGLRNTQQLGDYVLAHAYVREDHVLDDDLPVWVPIPALAEVQVALEESVAEVAGVAGWDLKRVMRTGTVASTDNRNWELQDSRGPIRRLSQSRAIALDMESAAIAANGFRFRVPYGTLLCVSDRPLHGELKLPGMASEFYQQQVGQHLRIGLRALEKLASMEPDRLHSRKLRSFEETAFQ